MTTILVVDDELAICLLMQEILEEEGYVVLTAGNGREALAQIQRTPPDLILSDVMMPLLSGTELCHTLQHNPDYPPIPIILASAAPSLAHQAQCHACRVLLKPFEITTLLTTIHHCLGPRAGS